jgi:hypothetical protein
MRPCQSILELEDLRKSFSGPLCRNGAELSSDDSRTVIDVYLQLILLMIDLGYLHHETLRRDAGRLLTDMVNKDVLALNNAFAELAHLVRCRNLRGFKVLCREISFHLYPLVKDDISSLSQSDVMAAKRLIQLFSFTSRLSLHDIDLTQQCLDGYMAVEQQMPDRYPSHLTTSLNKIIRSWLKSFDDSSLVPNHGPGGVAGHGRCSIQTKYQDLTSDQLLEYAFGSPVWTYGNVKSTMDRISQTIFVPKSYKTFRTISMESSTTQYFQQSVWKEIDRVVGSSSYLRNRIGFHEQERNQRLAQLGSIGRTHATIDLSAASDSVSYTLVKELFRGTRLLRYLVATRSTKTLLPDGRLIALKKFAPMGSALCFPVETIIFAAICRFVTREHGLASDFSVFGDDIIVPTQCAEDVMCVLGSLGFTPNREKSFFRQDCWFRESCGIECCDGFDVTPVRISRKYKHNERFERLSAYVDTANAAYVRGFRHLRHFYLLRLREEGYIPFFSSNALLGDSYSNYHTKRRWNYDLQRIDCECTTLVSKAKGSQDETLRLRYWLETTANRKFVHDGFESDIRRSSVSTKRQWMSKPYEGPDQPFIDFFVAAGSK